MSELLPPSVMILQTSIGKRRVRTIYFCYFQSILYVFECKKLAFTLGFIKMLDLLKKREKMSLFLVKVLQEHLLLLQNQILIR